MERKAATAWRVLGLGVLLAASSAAARAEYVFTLFEVPGAAFTDVRGINNSGQVVGYASGTSDNYAFIYSGGSFIKPTGPAGYSGFSFSGINDSGVAVGSANVLATGPSPVAGLIYSGGTMTTVSRAGWDQTWFRAVGSSGLVTGYSNMIGGAGVAFTYSPTSGIFTDLTPRGAATNIFDIAQGINAAGQIVGSTRLTGPGTYPTTSGFLFNPATGTYDLFQVGGLPTRARGINDTGLITGFADELSATGDYLRSKAYVANSSGYEWLAPTSIGGRTVTNIYGQGINNLGQVVGLFNDDLGNTFGFMAAPSELPTGTTADGGYTFDVAVVPDTPIFIDPFVAIGYDYTTGDGDPNFASVSLPIGIGDSLYKLIVGELEFDLAGGVVFDFIANGFAGGVSKFGVRGIETSAALNPDDPAAFVTQLTFAGRGRFTGSMTPISVFVPDATVPEPSALALAGLGLLALVPALRRRRR
jgi:probable HAF family extracellular repeat protein